MFRRAKRMLEDVPTEVLEAAAARPAERAADVTLKPKGGLDG